MSDLHTKSAFDMAYAAKVPGKSGYVAICADEPRFAKDVAEFIAEHVGYGNTIEHVTRDAAISGFKEYSNAN